MTVDCNVQSVSCSSQSGINHEEDILTTTMDKKLAFFMFP